MFDRAVGTSGHAAPDSDHESCEEIDDDDFAYDDASDCSSESYGDDSELLSSSEANGHAQMTTVHRYIREPSQCLSDPSNCDHTFVRVADNLWLHIGFIEDRIHTPVRHHAVPSPAVISSITFRGSSSCPIVNKIPWFADVGWRIILQPTRRKL